jgi:hypothetical protein
MLIDTPFDRIGEQGVDVYSCLDCGHLEFFSTTAVDKYKELLLRKSNISAQLESLEKHRDDLDNITTIHEIEKRLKEEYYTDSQKPVIMDRLKDLKAQVGERLNEIVDCDERRHQRFNLDQQIGELKNQLYRIEQDIARVKILNE